jgi:hypothetical protein
MRRRVKAGAALKAMTPFPSPRRRRHHRRAAGWRTSAQPPSRSVCLSAQPAVGASAKHVNMPQGQNVFKILKRELTFSDIILPQKPSFSFSIFACILSLRCFYMFESSIKFFFYLMWPIWIKKISLSEGKFFNFQTQIQFAGKTAQVIRKYLF